MPSLLPSCVIPETMKTSMIIVKKRGDDIYGIFSNFNTRENIIFDSTMKLLFEVDSMLEAYLSSISKGILDKFSFDSFEQMATKLENSIGKYPDKTCSFFIKIWFARNSQWKGSLEWIEGNESLEFKTTSELMGILVNVLDRTDCKTSEYEKIGSNY